MPLLQSSTRAATASIAAAAIIPESRRTATDASTPTGAPTPADGML